MTAEQAKESLLAEDPTMTGVEARERYKTMHESGELDTEQFARAMDDAWQGRMLQHLVFDDVELRDGDYPDGEYWQRRNERAVSHGTAVHR